MAQHALAREIPAEPPIDDWNSPRSGGGGDDELPRRPRRKVLTPVTGSLMAVMLAAGGFAGGVTVEKHRGTATTAAGGFPGGGTGTGGPPGIGGTGQASTDSTTGTVTYAKGDVFYVKDA